MKRAASILLILIIFFSQSSVFADVPKTPSGIPLSDLEAVVDEYIEGKVGKTVPGAAVIITKDYEIILSKGYGYADIGSKIPMEPDQSVLEWGSITKLFVWVSAMQLAEQGELDLNADIRSYLSDGFLTKLNFNEPITMVHLMNHTAGFEDDIFDLLYDSPELLPSLEEALKLQEPEQMYEPGTVVAYSNYSTSLAAFIIEQITGQTFYDYVSEHIFSPMEMHDTTIHLTVEENEEILRNKTKGYMLTETGEWEEFGSSYMSLYPSGGINGTAADLAKFAMALMPAEGESSPLFEKTETLKELLSPSYSVDKNVPGIAHGFWKYKGKYRGLTHSGNTVAFSSNLHFVPEENFSAIVLTNQAGEADLTYDLVHELVKGEEVPTVGENVPHAEAFEGTYLSARRMHSGFMNLYYYYFIPLQVKALNEQEVEMNMAGLKANYVQTSPNVFELANGHPAFIPNNTMYFHLNDGTVEQISTTFSDYLPMDRSSIFNDVTLGMFIWCALFFLIAPIVLLLRKLMKKRRKSTPLTRWKWLLVLSGTGIILNIFSLAFRMLSKANRSYSELFIHFGLNYLLTAIVFIALFMIIVKWKKESMTRLEKTGYVLTSISSVLLVGWMIMWQVYL